jgi:Mn2+/Fe2+ NRAMP family transporter
MVTLATVLVLIPGAPLIEILFLSQALNAVLLLVLLPFMRALGRDRELMGRYALGRGERLVTGAVLTAVASSVVALAVLAIFH